MSNNFAVNGTVKYATCNKFAINGAAKFVAKLTIIAVQVFYVLYYEFCRDFQ
jgi:hypothetical protein